MDCDREPYLDGKTPNENGPIRHSAGSESLGILIHSPPRTCEAHNFNLAIYIRNINKGFSHLTQGRRVWAAKNSKFF